MRLRVSAFALGAATHLSVGLGVGYEPSAVAQPARVPGAAWESLGLPPSTRVRFAAGAFAMGSDEEEVELAVKQCQSEHSGLECREELFAVEYPVRDVQLPGYYLDRWEVSWERYERCVHAGSCQSPPYGPEAARFVAPRLPVVLVTWKEAHDFCAWAGGRLPTEAEWERAARGLSRRRYPWGDLLNPYLANHGRAGEPTFDTSDGFAELAPVDAFPDGRTPEGVMNLAGNVEEWVADLFEPGYPPASTTAPQGPSAGEERVIRGGGYLHTGSRLRAAAREKDSPLARKPWRGFRCAYGG